MAEAVIVDKKKEKKKKLKTLSIIQAVKILKPIVKKWKKQDKETALKMYEIYKKCDFGDWVKILDRLKFPKRTWYDWCDHYKFKLNFPEMSHADIGAVSHQITKIIPDGKGGTKTVVETKEIIIPEHTAFERINGWLHNILGLGVTDINSQSEFGKEILVKLLKETNEHIEDLLKQLR
jgi:hypothetical protein